MWSRAVWIEENKEVEGIIPNIWVEGKNVRWPSGINVKRAARGHEAPKNDWHTFELVKVKCTSEDKETCDEYNYTTTCDASDLEKEVNANKLKKRGSNKCSQKEPPKDDLRDGEDETSSSDEDSRDGDTSSFPKPPEKDASRKRGASPPRNTSAKKPRTNSPSPTETSQHSASKKGSSVFPISDTRFQQRVLQMLSEIKNTLAQVGKRCEPEDSDFHLEKLTTLEQLKVLEDSLQDEEKQILLLSRLSKIGGINVKENVNNVMHRLMANIVMASMNCKGRGGKYAFCQTKIFEIVKKSVLKVQPSATESDITRQIKSLLKYAPDRIGGGGRK